MGILEKLNKEKWQTNLQFSVDSSTAVSVRSKIGLDPSNNIDEEYIENENIDVANSNYTKCVIAPCLHYPDEAFLDGEEDLVESRATVLLKSALPSFNNGDRPWPNQHAKQVFIRQLVNGVEVDLHTMHVVITYVAGLWCVRLSAFPWLTFCRANSFQGTFCQ